MKSTLKLIVQRTQTLFSIASVLIVGPLVLRAQQLSLANPHWNITLTDYGYSDFMLDNTPGFEGREYLSGEWAAAVAYQVAGQSAVTPQWFEPAFIFPDWATQSPFHVASPLTQTGLNMDNLPIAESVITNSDVQLTLRYEMIDTIVGTPMGVTPASATGEAVSIRSDRYVLKQTCTIKNISGAGLSNLQLFQMLHGYVSQRGVYDNRVHAGPLSEFRYDITQAGVDTYAIGAGSSSEGLEDFIGFHASIAPSAFELGHYGIEGNGVDDHAMGKPTDGVHLSIENNWQIAPYAARQGTDNFTPPRRWVAGVQRWDLGPLAAGGSASIDVLLTLRTGTRVGLGTHSSGGCNGGSSVAGGLDYEFEDVSSEGSCFGEYSEADESEIEVRIAAGEFEPFSFLTPGQPAQIWEVEFTGAFSGSVNLTFGYDPMLLPAGFDESALCLYQFNNGAWQKLPGAANPASHSIAVTATSLGVFALGVEGGVTVTIDTSTLPTNSGTIAGAGIFAEGSAVTLTATPSPGYAFSNWTENGVVIIASPSYTFTAQTDRALVANFFPVGDSRAINTSSLPSNGGTTSGDGAYAPGSSATVSATAYPGYKFSKWLDGATVASTARNYTFTVTGNRSLVAKFKPVYPISVAADPPSAGEVEADPAYEFGELAVLKAKPDDGWSFVNWTQNGVAVSDDAFYSFNVTSSRDLVAHFALGNRIDVLAEPPKAGMVSGGGVYANSSPVFVEAIANPGYVFAGWTENGAAISATPGHGFTSETNRTLVATFIAQPALACGRPSADALTLSWPAAASGWLLEETPDLSAGTWVDSLRATNIVNGQCLVTVASSEGHGFFRLVHRPSQTKAKAIPPRSLRYQIRYGGGLK